MKKLMAVITIISCVIASFFVWVVFSREMSAVQQSAGAALACAVVIIPYCAARSFEMLSSDSDNNNSLS